MQLHRMPFRALLGVLAAWLVVGASPLRAEEQRYAESVAEGVVVEVDFEASTMMIEGYRYRFAPDLPVQIGGSAGAVTMVTPGMQVQYRFLRVPDGLRELVEIRQIPPGVKIYSP